MHERTYDYERTAREVQRALAEQREQFRIRQVIREDGKGGGEVLKITKTVMTPEGLVVYVV